MTHINKLSIKSQNPVKAGTLSKKKEDCHKAGHDILSMIDDKVDLSTMKGPSVGDCNIFQLFGNKWGGQIESGKVNEVVSPEMKPAAHKLIDRMKTIAQAGQGEIPLVDILNLVPDVPSDIAGEIEKRGAVKFKSRKSSSLAFENKGKKMEFDIPVGDKEYTLKIPEKVNGAENVSSDSFTMNFDPDNTIKVGKFFIYFGLEKLEVCRDKIFVDFEGDMADTLIKFE